MPIIAKISVGIYSAKEKIVFACSSIRSDSIRTKLAITVHFLKFLINWWMDLHFEPIADESLLQKHS